jgi:hypothetical protein
VARIADTLARAVSLATSGRGRLLAPPLLQSWPGIVHGGGLVALFDSATATFGRPGAPRTVEGRLTSPIPIGKPLVLVGQGDGDAIRLTVLDGDQTLASSSIGALDPSVTASARWRGRPDGWLLPRSEHCLACGTLNPLGLQVGLRFDDEGVWASIEPPATWQTPDGRVHPALGPVLLDEIAWWLGALAMKEGGLTNRIHLRLHQPEARAKGPVVGAGRFDAVTAVDRKRSFWRTETALLAADGSLIATASIVFRGGTDYSIPQMEYFSARTLPDIFRRMFPNHALAEGLGPPAGAFPAG